MLPPQLFARILEKVNSWTGQLKPVRPTAEQVPLQELAKPEPSVTGEDPYLSLPWKQSQKKQNLGTILATAEVLETRLPENSTTASKNGKP